MTTNPQDAFNK